MKEIFADCEIQALEVDNEYPGVFIKSKKPIEFVEKELSNYKLYNMITGSRKSKISNKDFKSLHFIKMNLRNKSRSFVLK